MKTQIVLVGTLLLVLAGGAAMAPEPQPADLTPDPTPTASLAPPPPPTAPAAPDIGGTWDVTRSWFRRCPSCSEPVIRGTTWEIVQSGHELRVDKGLRGTIDGYDIHLQGIESDGFSRFDFYYSRLYLSPDGLRITGEFVGSETLQNPCAPSPPIVTCFAHGGYLYAIRRSPAPTFPPPPTPGPSVTETPPSTRTPTPSVTPSPTEASAGLAPVSRHYLPLITRPASPSPADD